MLRTLARTAPYLAPLPSAWFIGRSIYLHLLHDWPLPIPPLVNITVATIAGISIEVLAIVSVHNGLALFRWNDQPRVRSSGWERAPFWLAAVCLVLYMVAAALLLIVLEAIPWLSRYAPIMFPLLGLVGALNLGILDQHLSRLERYNLTWELRSNDDRSNVKRPPNEPRTIPDRPAIEPRTTYTCSEPGCNYVGTSPQALAGHTNAHRTRRNDGQERD